MISPTNRFKKIIAISSFCLILPAAHALYAQEADEVPVDSTLEEKISDMWHVTSAGSKKWKKSESLWMIRSSDYFGRAPMGSS